MSYLSVTSTLSTRQSAVVSHVGVGIVQISANKTPRGLGGLPRFSWWRSEGRPSVFSYCMALDRSGRIEGLGLWFLVL